MNRDDYEELQNSFSNKLLRYNQVSKKEAAYNSGILACKSVLHDVYSYYNNETIDNQYIILKNRFTSKMKLVQYGGKMIPDNFDSYTKGVLYCLGIIENFYWEV